MTEFAARSCRPRDHLVAASRLYPNAWGMFDTMRADRGKSLPAWPLWCYLPMAGAYAAVCEGNSLQVLGPQHLSLAGDVGRLAALGAWRVTQGVYRFDPAVYEAVAGTALTGDVPHDVLYRLPEWCVYIETPGLNFGGPLHGVFAHLEWDVATFRTELRLLLDGEAALLPLPLHVGDWSLQEAIQRAADAASVQALGAGMMALPPVPSDVRAALEPIVSLLLYLCAQNAEIGDGTCRPVNPEPKRVKTGWRLFAAQRVTTWDVGVRLGSAMRRAYQAEQTGEATHAGPRPHIRRAHWHGFWSGPRDGARQFDLRWLPPIAVNVDDVEGLPATVRPVK